MATGAVWPLDPTILKSSTGRSTPLSLREPIDSTAIELGQKPPEGVGDHHLARRGLRLGAGGDVRGVADGRVAAASQAPHHDASAVYGDAHLEIEPGRLGELPDRLQHIQRATDHA